MVWRVRICESRLYPATSPANSSQWLALGKVILIAGLIIFTFITMAGGNPLQDKFGFRYWRNPGAFAELYYEGNLGRFLGFLQCLIQASFTIAGPG
jgi:amino acid transporter